MKISFSVANILNTNTQKILKDCELIFIPASANATERDKAKELIGDKCIELVCCDSSKNIISYIQTRDSGAVNSYPELTELETIYQMLPKGVELTLHYVRSLRRVATPVIITLPLETI